MSVKVSAKVSNHAGNDLAASSCAYTMSILIHDEMQLYMVIRGIMYRYLNEKFIPARYEVGGGWCLNQALYNSI